MQYIVAYRIHAEIIYEVIRIDHISFGFAHLAAAHKKPGMSKYLLRQRLAQCHQENRPVDGMEPDDILTDQMQICGPQLLVLLGAVAVCIIADTGDVIGQRIQPYIDNMLGIESHRNTPGEGSTGYAQIL